MSNSRVLDKAKEKADKILNEGMLFRLLQWKYPASEYVLLDQVKSDTSVRARTADAIAIGLWKNRNFSIEGFEFKVTRASWIQELKDPAKAEEIMQFCDKWWLVASDESIVRPEELPKNWGLYVPNDQGMLKVAVPAPDLKPKEPDRIFLSCVVKRIVDKRLSEVREEDLRKEYERGKAEGKAKGEQTAIAGKDEMIQWLHAELYRAKGKLTIWEDSLLNIHGLDESNLAIWAQIIKEVTLQSKLALREPEQIRSLLNTLRFLNGDPEKRLYERLLRLKTEADVIAGFIGSKLADMNLLNGNHPEEEKTVQSEPQ